VEYIGRTCVLGIDGEFVELVGGAVLESLTPGLDLGRVAFTDEQFERRVGNVLAVLQNVDQMFADFIR